MILNQYSSIRLWIIFSSFRWFVHGGPTRSFPSFYPHHHWPRSGQNAPASRWSGPLLAPPWSHPLQGVRTGRWFLSKAQGPTAARHRTTIAPASLGCNPVPTGWIWRWRESGTSSQSAEMPTVAIPPHRAGERARALTIFSSQPGLCYTCNRAHRYGRFARCTTAKKLCALQSIVATRPTPNRCVCTGCSCAEG